MKNYFLTTNNKPSIGMLITLIILIVLLVLLISFLIFLYFKKKKIGYKSNKNHINSGNNFLEKKKAELEEEISYYHENNKLLQEKLEQVTGLSFNQAKLELLHSISRSLPQIKKDKLNQIYQEIDKKAKKYSVEVLLQAMEGIADECVNENTTYTVPLKDESIKAHIIGKGGNNIRFIKECLGVDIIVEKNSAITISSFNPRKREIAKRVMQIIVNKNINPITVKKIYDEQVAEFEKEVYLVGQDAVIKLHISDMNKKLYSYIGKLNYRTSFSQNVLQHSVEVARICASIAKDLHLDPIKAAKIGLLHDIGKSEDYEIDMDHVKQGVKIIKDYFQDPDYINAIKSHHNEIQANNPYSWILKIADKMSAARPGSRINDSSKFIERVETIEQIAYSFPEVVEAHVYRAGRELLVYIDPNIAIEPDEYKTLYDKIEKRLKKDERTNYLSIQITISQKRVYSNKTAAVIK